MEVAENTIQPAEAYRTIETFVGHTVNLVRDGESMVSHVLAKVSLAYRASGAT